jgi:hypothetical protein
MQITSSSEMRQFLIEQMIGTANGKIEVGQAKAVCNLAQQIYNTVKLEMSFASLKHKEGMQKIEAVRFDGAATKTRSLRAA